MYDVANDDVMSTTYQQKCRSLVYNFKRNIDLVMSVKNYTLSVDQLLQKSNRDLATLDQKKMRAQMIKEAAKASIKLDDIAWLPSKREVCPSCGQKHCEYVVLSSGTSHKDETWGGNNDERTMWRCKECGKKWQDDDVEF